MRLLKQLMLIAPSFLILGCGEMFNYQSDDIKAAEDSGKKFEDLDDAEVQSILDEIGERKLPAFSTVKARQAFGIVRGALDPGVK